MDPAAAPPPRTRTSGRAWRWLFLSLLLLIGIAIAVAVLVSRRGAPEPRIPPGATPAGGGTIGVLVTPEDGRGPLLEEIAAAKREITLQIYLISDDEIVRALSAAASRGVKVRVLLEEHPYGGGGGQPEAFDRLKRAGLDVRWSNPAFRFSHVKTFTIDGTVAIVMNLNLTASAFRQNREFAVITTRPADVAQAVALFEADWNRSAEPPGGPLVVSPTDARSELLGLIDGAQRTLDMYAEVLRDDAFTAALSRAAGRGVRVRIVMSPGDDRQRETLLALVDAGVQARLVTDVYIHAKAIVVDGERAFVGSQNLTSTSLDQNREIGVIVDDPGAVERIQRVFDLDFRLGREVTR